MLNDNVADKKLKKIVGTASEYVIQKLKEEDDQKKAKPKSDESKSV